MFPAVENKKVNEINNEIDNIFQTTAETNESDVSVDKIKQLLNIEIQKIKETADQYYGSDITNFSIIDVNKLICQQAEEELTKYYTEYNSKKAILINERKQKIEKAVEQKRMSDINKINKEFLNKEKEIVKKYSRNINKTVKNTLRTTANLLVATGKNTLLKCS